MGILDRFKGSKPVKVSATGYDVFLVAGQSNAQGAGRRAPALGSGSPLMVGFTSSRGAGAARAVLLPRPIRYCNSNSKRLPASGSGSG